MTTDPDPGLTSRQPFRPPWLPTPGGSIIPFGLDQPFALPEGHALKGDRPAKVRVYRAPADPEDPELGPCWHWRCDTCLEQSNGCAHVVIHEPGTWRAAMCGGFRHIHVRHPRPVPADHTEHTTMFGRRRCFTGPPSERIAGFARTLLADAPRQRDPLWDVAREFAREILALADEQAGRPEWSLTA